MEKGPYSGNQVSVGQYLGLRLMDAGVQEFFTVPGDFSMVLLDEMLKADGMNFVGCCNELNAGYAADGYARSSGKIGVVVVTYMVGALSAINAVAGAFSDDLPLLIVVGSPNTHDVAERKVVHHSLGGGSLDQCQRCFDSVVSHSFSIRNLKDAPGMIDNAVLMALSRRKPIYLEVACNLASLTLAQPSPTSEMHQIIRHCSDRVALEAVVREISSKIENEEDIVLIAGAKLNAPHVLEAFQAFSKRLSCAVAVMPDAKGRISEEDERFVGCYWGSVSTHFVEELVESSKLIIMVGPVLNDYTTVGWTTKLLAEKTIIIAPDHVHVDSKRFSYVFMQDVLEKLSKSVPKRDKSMLKFQEFQTHKKVQSSLETDRLTLHHVKSLLQENIHIFSQLVVDTGDSWFVGQSLKLGKGTSYHIQMQYGSIGWSLPALLGIGLHAKRMHWGKSLLIIGDGAFQVTCQELSTILRHQLNAVILIINNEIYTIEQQIHPGPYNEIAVWDYTRFAESLQQGPHSNFKHFKIKSPEEMKHALDCCNRHEGVALLECCIAKTDCSEELRIWGEHVAKANSRN